MAYSNWKTVFVDSIIVWHIITCKVASVASFYLNVYLFSFPLGSVYAGLKVHPDREHFIYPLGNTVIVEHITSHRQYFLTGHTNDVSCIAVSNSGKYLASGQITHMGFKVRASHVV